MKALVKSVIGAVSALAMLALATSVTLAEPLKLRLSVESTPGASTQYMLASLRDALKAEMGDDVAVVKGDAVPADAEGTCKEAADDCPVEAIKVE